MSALPPKADIHQGIEQVCFVPEADIGRRQTCPVRLWLAFEQLALTDPVGVKS